MPDISKLSGIDIDSIAKMSGVTKSSIAKVGGVSKSSGPSIRTSDLQIWWEAADGDGGVSPISSSHRRIVNKANSDGYANPAIEGDHRLLNGSSSNWTTVDGVDAILLDGSNDNILTRQLYLGTDHSANDPFNEGLGASNIYYHNWNDQYDNGDGFTVEIWVRSFGSTWGRHANIFSAYKNSGFRLRTSSSGSNAPLNFIRIMRPSGSSVAWNPSETLPAGEWVHLTFTADPGNQIALYKNAGTPSTNTSIEVDPDSWVRNTMVLGAYQTNGQEAEKFYIGEYRMYDKVLSASDILANYNATKANYGIT